MKTKAKYLINQINPEMVSAFFMVIRKNQIYSKEEVAKRLDKKNLLTRSFSKYLKELSVTLSQFGMLELNSVSGEYALSDFGIQMKKLLLRNKALFFEIYQLISYHIFDLKNQDFDLLPFRSYQILCNYIFESKNLNNTKLIADFVDSKIRDSYEVEGSFSEVCITRGMAWLKALYPPAIDEDRKRHLRKPSFNSILLVSIDYYYKLSTLQYGDPLFISQETKVSLSRPILMSTEYVEEMLREISRQFPQYLKIKYNITGTYVILNKEVFILDIL